MSDRSCVFCERLALEILAENAWAFAIRDKHPAKPLHTLIIPKRHISNIFETDAEEREAIHALALSCRAAICREDPSVEGFNFGSNVGIAAGQKIFHAHVHLIPRRPADNELPPAQPD